MPELRVDPLSGLRVLFAPGELPEAHAPAAPAATVELLRPDAEAPPREAALDLFTSAAARGHHEVLALPAPLAELSPDGLAEALEGWRDRLAAHADAAHVHLWVDPPGTHLQLAALDFVPAAVARERERAAAYAARTQGSDLLGDLVQAEVRLRARLVAHDPEVVLLSPYASRVPYALMVVPRTPAPRWQAPGPLGAAGLHRALRALGARLGTAQATVWIRTAPRGAEHFCWRIDVAPATLPPDGMALGLGVPVNRVLPEQATAELRAALGRDPESRVG